MRSERRVNLLSCSLRAREASTPCFRSEISRGTGSGTQAAFEAAWAGGIILACIMRVMMSNPDIELTEAERKLFEVIRFEGTIGDHEAPNEEFITANHTLELTKRTEI
jgi:hypothetical protein